MKRLALAALAALTVCAPAHAITLTHLQSAIDAARAKSAARIWTPAEEAGAIKNFIEAYWESNPGTRTWSQWLFNDPPAGVTISGVLFSTGTVSLGYGSFDQNPDDFQGSTPMVAYDLASVRYYSYADDPAAAVFLGESFNIADNFRMTLNVSGFEPVIKAVPFDSQGNRIIVLDSNGENGADAFALILTPVPEPATWALMIGGFGFAGASLRRRRHEMTT